MVLNFFLVAVILFPATLVANTKARAPSSVELQKSNLATAPRPRITVKDEQGQVINLKNRIDYVFIENQEKVRVFYIQILLRFDKNLKTVTAADSETLVKENKLRLRMNGLSQDLEVNFEDGTLAKYSIALSYTQVPFIQENCVTKKFAIVAPKKIKDNFYVAASCNIKAGGVDASLSIPQDTSWGVSSLFESAGKGERWKLFQFNQLTLSSKKEEIGRLTILKNEKPTNFYVVITPGVGGKEAESKPEKTNPFLFGGGIGYGQVSAATTSLSTSKSGAAATIFGLYSGPESSWLVDANYKLQITTQSEAQTFNIFQGGLGYRMGSSFGNGTSYVGSLRFDSLTSQAPELRTSFLHSQMGLGFGVINYQMKSKSGWSLMVSGSGYLPKANSTVLGADLFIHFGGDKMGKSIELSYLTEKFLVPTNTALDSTSSQLFGFFVLTF
jgi:hypothetical protein